MLTRIAIRNFKRFHSVEIELGNPVVFIGPNNSGKTTALQALALWDIGLRRWNEKRSGKQAPEKRPGVTINRRDLVSVPVPTANLLWRRLHVQDTQVEGDQKSTRKVRIEVVVDGVTEGRPWSCGLEFDYANEESFYCRPLRLAEDRSAPRMAVPPEALDLRLAFLPPMSGLAANETRLDRGAIDVRLGEGRTAEVLRNLCHQIVTSTDGGAWEDLSRHLERLFGVKLEKPQYVKERGEITMAYRDRAGLRLDLSCTGRGLQQTLLLLAHLAVNPRSVLLLDEPDAHLEILRQRQTYQILCEAAQTLGSQVVVASHSEIILNEAAQRDVVVAFVGSPHRLDDRGSQVLKALRQIGFDEYYQAEQTGWVLYLEGATDLAVLRAFSETLDHPARRWFDRPFVHYVQNQPQKARDHFFGLREAKKDLVGIALFDRLQDETLAPGGPLRELMWRKREIENYLCQREVLVKWARNEALPISAPHWVEALEQAVDEVQAAMATLGKGSPWSDDTKVSDDFLDPLFARFYKRLGLPNTMRKSEYHVLARFVPPERIDPEVTAVLDMITDSAAQARPAEPPE